ncbi:MAG: cytochrome-c peroxidase [Balneola sp.]|nr:MAG: cytochrome-c peroxidase [Balneola sp.]
MRPYKNLFLALIFLFVACEEASNNSVAEEEILETEEAAVLDQYLNLPDQAYNYADPDLPAFFNQNDNEEQDNTPNNNPVTDWGATLGRVLFYDVNLSANNTISCASCHVQEDGFSDPNQFSEGFEGGLTGRNSMGLSSAAFYENGNFFWDERAGTLEEQVLLPIQDAIEMGLTLEEMVVKVSAQEYYPILFTRTFGDDEITSNRISLALSQFVRSMVSYQSKYDVGRAQVNDSEDDFPNFTDLENLGKRVFFSNNTDCSNCHTSDHFVGDEARNNGLDAVLTDLGLGEITGRNQDNGKFKTNSLKNIELTAPYMHDGRFATLEEVVEHYDSGIQNSPNLDNRLSNRNGTPVRMNLSNQEKAALVAFMKTLTDTELITDEKFSNPFRDN